MWTNIVQSLLMLRKGEGVLCDLFYKGINPIYEGFALMT